MILSGIQPVLFPYLNFHRSTWSYASITSSCSNEFHDIHLKQCMFHYDNGYMETVQKDIISIVGRITVLVLVGLSIVWIPILEEAQGGLFWFYLQSIRSYLLPPMCVLFLLAFFWKRLTEQVYNSDFLQNRYHIQNL